MDVKPDAELLRAFAERGDEAAFGEIVSRHTDLIYSAALRQVYSSDLAADVTQSVFTDLARKAASVSNQLSEQASVIGWLYRGTRYLALNVRREELRRQNRERISMEQLLPVTESMPDWEKLRPLLDEAMAELEEVDREALLLRYFKNQDFRTVGNALGVSDDTAQKRVSRAAEKLREILAKHGFTATAGTLAVLVTTNSVQSAPVGLAAALSSLGLIGISAKTSTAAAITKTIAMTTLQKTLIGVALTIAIAFGVFEASQITSLRGQIETLKKEKASVTEQFGKLQHEQNENLNRMKNSNSAVAKVDNSELLRLRAEVTRLRSGDESRDVDPAMKILEDRVALLKRKLREMPDKSIPELAFLTEADWVTAVSGADLKTDAGVREALSKLREQAINTFLNVMMKVAIKKYLAANGNILPPDLFPLRSYFDAPVTDEMLQRYKLLQSGTPNQSGDLVKLISNVDSDYDSNHAISIGGAWGGAFNKVRSSVEDAAIDFANANNGQIPTHADQLNGYLEKPLDSITTQKYLDEVVSNPPPSDIIALAPVYKAYKKANPSIPIKSMVDLQPYVTTPAQQNALDQRILKEKKSNE